MSVLFWAWWKGLPAVDHYFYLVDVDHPAFFNQVDIDHCLFHGQPLEKGRLKKAGRHRPLEKGRLKKVGRRQPSWKRQVKKFNLPFSIGRRPGRRSTLVDVCRHPFYIPFHHAQQKMNLRSPVQIIRDSLEDGFKWVFGLRPTHLWKKTPPPQQFETWVAVK